MKLGECKLAGQGPEWGSGARGAQARERQRTQSLFETVDPLRTMPPTRQGSPDPGLGGGDRKFPST